MSYTLKYRTFDSLLADCANDFKKYQMRDLIDASELIKVARKCNYDLGLRIYKKKEVVLEVDKGRVRLPNDFFIYNFAMVIVDYQGTYQEPQGHHIEECIVGKLQPEWIGAPVVPSNFCEHIDPVVPVQENDCVCPQCGETMVDNVCHYCCRHPESCSLDCKGNVIQIVQKQRTKTYYYQNFAPLNIVSSVESDDDICNHLLWPTNTGVTGSIKDGWLYVNFERGKIYLNYQGHLVDKDDNILVPDHEKLNDYYEYAIKRRIIENLIMNDEEVNPSKVQIIEQRFIQAEFGARSLVNTPDFAELKALYKMNRNAMFSKYYDMFASSPRYNQR